MRNEAVMTKKLLGEIVKHAKKAMAEIDKVNALCAPFNEVGDWFEARRFAMFTNLIYEISKVSGIPYEKVTDNSGPLLHLDLNGVPVEQWFVREGDERYE